MAILALVIVLILVWFYRYHNRTQTTPGYTQSEGYADVFYNKDMNGHMLSRPSFTSNLDPNNPDLRFDPNVYGGYIRGESPNPAMLAATNTVDTTAGLVPGQSENFRVALPPVRSTLSSENPMTGVNDAAASVTYSDYAGDADAGDQAFIAKLSNTVQTGASTSIPVVAPEGSEFERQGSSFSTLIDEVDGTFATKRKNEVAKYQASLTKKYQADSQTYTATKDLLPTPDMRQASMRDPSDPSNYIYDRTIFAKLKPRYGTVADKVRGDLSITPLKTGWFDVRSTPSTDLVKGYFGSYTDIQENVDLQDAVFSRASLGASDNTFSTSINDRINQVTNAMAQLAAKPQLAYGSPAPITYSGQPENQQLLTEGNPWFDSLNQVSNRSFQSP